MPNTASASITPIDASIRPASTVTAARTPRRRPRRALSRLFVSAAVAMVDTMAVAGAAVMTSIVYRHGASLTQCVALGAVTAALFVLTGLARGDYDLRRYASFEGHAGRGAASWCMAMLGALVLAYLTKASADLSRGSVLILFATGFAGVMAARAGLVHVAAARLRTGDIVARRIFLVGDEGMIRAFTERHDPERAGLRLVGAVVLRTEPDCRAEDLALAVASARVLRPDDIYILVPWADAPSLGACVDTFMRLPAAIHLAPERFFERFDDLDVVRTGPMASLHLVKRPLTTMEVTLKRLVDIVVAATALLCLAPVLVAVAIAIKIDSSGPVMFRQRRYGFNQEPFRIMKFRSMRTFEDSRVVRQATRDDPRITAVGRFIRRTNLDELPQLINVLKGDMSLVGPRPHAMVHDQAFEREIALYARRHNVKPGITGWAQVNGWRGETDTADKIRGRVEHDLHYIDHWSLLLDVSILFRTAFSRKAYKNAR